MHRKISPKKAKEIKITKLNEKYIKFLDNYSRIELLLALTVALSSKLISSEDANGAVARIVSSEKRLKNAFGLSESFLLFVTQAFIRDSAGGFLTKNK
ncbi:MAG: hypothetical protein WCS86_03625 [Candidatus Paceibacterota bacterium]|jgi:hypothetical protein